MAGWVGEFADQFIEAGLRQGVAASTTNALRPGAGMGGHNRHPGAILA